MFTLLVQIPVCVNDLIQKDLGRLPDGYLIRILHIEVFHLGFLTSLGALGNLVVKRGQRDGGVLALDPLNDFVLLFIQPSFGTAFDTFDRPTEIIGAGSQEYCSI